MASSPFKDAPQSLGEGHGLETSGRLWLELPIVRAAHLPGGARSLDQPVSQFVGKYKQGIMVGV